MHTVNLHINNKNIKQENFVKYLGIIIDSNLNWYHHVHELSKKVKRSMGIFSKIRHYINLSTLKQLYYSLIYSHLSYGIIIWGNTYTSTLQPLIILQKRVLRIMTFANYDSHSSPIFRQLELLKINDLVFIHTALFMQQYYSKQLPETFDNLFQPLSCKHNYKTRLASKNNYCLPKARTNFGKFNVRYYGVKIWTSLDSSEKLMNKSALKKKLSSDKIATY